MEALYCYLLYNYIEINPLLTPSDELIEAIIESFAFLFLGYDYFVIESEARQFQEVLEY